MTASIIDGRAIAAELHVKVTKEVSRIQKDHDLTPGLAVILVGKDPASHVYVATKSKQTREAGMASFVFEMPETTEEDQILSLIASLNQDHNVHGILVQLPLPKHLNAEKIIEAISPDKDVDGLHPHNTGRLASGMSALSPCTPLGCIMLAKRIHPTLTGMKALVIGCSRLVGRPLIQMLLKENATVTVAHIHTVDVPNLSRQADILFTAVGKPEMVRGDWIKPGATVIDIGINRVMSDGQSRLVGDVAYAEAIKIAGAITPVPGGVGPMTVACLLLNTIQAACTLTNQLR